MVILRESLRNSNLEEEGLEPEEFVFLSFYLNIFNVISSDLRLPDPPTTETPTGPTEGPTERGTMEATKKGCRTCRFVIFKCLSFFYFFCSFWRRVFITHQGRGAWPQYEKSINKPKVHIFDNNDDDHDSD